MRFHFQEPLPRFLVLNGWMPQCHAQPLDSHGTGKPAFQRNLAYYAEGSLVVICPQCLPEASGMSVRTVRFFRSATLPCRRNKPSINQTMGCFSVFFSREEQGRLLSLDVRRSKQDALQCTHYIFPYLICKMTTSAQNCLGKNVTSHYASSRKLGEKKGIGFLRHLNPELYNIKWVHKFPPSSSSPWAVLRNSELWPDHRQREAAMTLHNPAL